MHLFPSISRLLYNLNRQPSNVHVSMIGRELLHRQSIWPKGPLIVFASNLSALYHASLGNSAGTNQHHPRAHGGKVV
jgi:hypothetical protein